MHFMFLQLTKIFMDLFIKNSFDFTRFGRHVTHSSHNSTSVLFIFIRYICIRINHIIKYLDSHSPL